ncbi:MAG: TrmJ/YjtD family RNA methyltransferase [Acidobacteria bacterium]|nr:TrmJ/YjtD family RNA methyltransferase [Acidobacteriota bacterium]
MDRLRIVLISPRNPLNIGAAARAISNFGFTHLRLVNPYGVAWREARSAVGASAVLERTQVFDSLAEALDDCTLVVGTTSIGHRELNHPLRRLEYGGRLLRKHLAAEPAALLFGSEKFGLSNEDLAHCHWLVRIPAREAHGSMNLGQAVAVCLYELIRDPRAAIAQPKALKPAAAGEVERFSALLLELLDSSGYTNPKTAASTAIKVRRMVRRLNLPGRDIETWQGILRQALWKSREPHRD